MCHKSSVIDPANLDYLQIAKLMERLQADLGRLRRAFNERIQHVFIFA